MHFQQMASEEVEALKAAIAEKKRELMSVQELMRQQGYAERQTRLSTCTSEECYIYIYWKVCRNLGDALTFPPLIGASL